MSKETSKYRIKTTIFLVSVIIVINAGAIFLSPIHWPIGFAISVIVVSWGSIFLFTRWHARNTAFVCPTCSQAFTVPALTFLWSANFLYMKLLSCPKCKKSSWCKSTSAKAIEGEVGRFEESQSLRREQYLLTAGILIGSLIVVGIQVYVWLFLQQL